MNVVDLVNMSLANIGVSNGLATTSDSTLEAAMAVLHYDHALRLVLRDFAAWPFATKFAGDHEGRNPWLLTAGPLWDTDPAVLTAVQTWVSSATYAPGDVVRLAGVNYTNILVSLNNTPPNATYWSTSSDDAPESANPDFKYGYRWPTDCLFVRRLVPPGDYAAARPYNGNPIVFKLGRDANGLVIYTNEPAAVLEYTAIDCSSLYSDDLFIRMFTWKLAELLTPTIARDQKTSDNCMAKYEYYRRLARVAAAREQQQQAPGDAEWIGGR